MNKKTIATVLAITSIVGCGKKQIEGKLAGIDTEKADGECRIFLTQVKVDGQSVQDTNYVLGNVPTYALTQGKNYTFTLTEIPLLENYISDVDPNFYEDSSKK